MSLHLNDTFLEEPWAFFVSDRKTVPVIFDTGASLAITHSIEDFVKPPQALDAPLFLGGMADGLEVSGIGKIAWTFEACDKSEIQIIIDCYYVLNGKARLLSPQRVLNEQQGLSGFYKGDVKFFSLCLEGLPSIDIPYHCSNGLPIAMAIPGECSPSVHLSLLTDDNQNLTGG